MPTPSPLTGAPTPLLTDAANIETAVTPGVVHLERFAIPRFSSTSARNVAFLSNPPEKGQVIYVASLGHLGYQVWNGESWEEFGLYTRTRTLYIENPSPHTTNSTSGTNTPLTLSLTPGIWKIDVMARIRRADGVTNNPTVGLGFAWNGGGTLNGNIFTTGSDTTSIANAPVSLRAFQISSGIFDSRLEAAVTSNSESTCAKIELRIPITIDTTFRLRMRRTGPSGGVTLTQFSYMEAYKTDLG